VLKESATKLRSVAWVKRYDELATLNRPHEFEIHLRGAINNGVTRDEIKEILFQTAAYCGWPAAIDSFRIARRVFAEADEAA